VLFQWLMVHTNALLRKKINTTNKNVKPCNLVASCSNRTSCWWFFSVARWRAVLPALSYNCYDRRAYGRIEGM
jgi:hypothetical protein